MLAGQYSSLFIYTTSATPPNEAGCLFVLGLFCTRVFVIELSESSGSKKAFGRKASGKELPNASSVLLFRRASLLVVVYLQRLTSQIL